MRQQLDAGQFYGRTLRRRSFGDLTLADVEYRAHSHLPRHSHERAYFCLIRRGTYVESYSRRTRVCAPMMLVFHPPAEPHSEAFDDEPVVSFNVELGAEWLCRLRELGGTFDQPIEFHAGRTVALGLRLFKEFARGNIDSDLSIESITLEILAAYISKRPTAAYSIKPDWLRRASETLDACLDQSLSLGSVAKSVGVHPVYFALMFRRFNGCSVGEYVRRRRIEYARRMLANPEIPLTQVALGAGFADQSHFTRTYKRFTGRTPSQDRTFLRFKTPPDPGS
ncbi:MAG TPA: AraC family transcriptional regulator [Candidatus Acidoferrum sp.]|nr:AraC family transcriptional regulator [Candidatus Acidoferrum sp.]